MLKYTKLHGSYCLSTNLTVLCIFKYNNKPIRLVLCTAGLLQITIKCIINYGNSNILLQIAAPFGVTCNYVKNSSQIAARVTNCGVIMNYAVTFFLYRFF